MHIPYQCKSAVKSSVALKKNDGPLKSRLEEGGDVISSVPGDGTISKSNLATTAPAHVNKVNKVNEAVTSLDATMPVDEELMALILLGIGDKRDNKSKSSCSKNFEVSSNGRSHTQRKGVAVDGHAAKDSLKETLKDGAVLIHLREKRII